MPRFDRLAGDRLTYIRFPEYVLRRTRSTPCSAPAFAIAPPVRSLLGMAIAGGLAEAAGGHLGVAGMKRKRGQIGGAARTGARRRRPALAPRTTTIRLGGPKSLLCLGGHEEPMADIKLKRYAAAIVVDLGTAQVTTRDSTVIVAKDDVEAIQKANNGSGRAVRQKDGDHLQVVLDGRVVKITRLKVVP